MSNPDHHLSPAQRPWCLDCGMAPADWGFTRPCSLPGARLADPWPGYRSLLAAALDPQTQIVPETPISRDPERGEGAGVYLPTS